MSLKIRQLNQLTKCSLRSLTTTSTDSAIPISKPKVTGSGPFAEFPNFKTIGNPSNILSVSLPQSSQFYINTSSLLGINGDLDSITYKSFNFFGKFFQILKSSKSSNLIINGNLNYKILKINKESNWSIYNINKIVGWSRGSLQFTPKNDTSILQVKGSGNLVINGGEVSKILEFEIDPKSEILINPISLIAINSANTTLEPTIITPNKYELHTLDHTFEWPSWLVQPIKNFNKSVREVSKKTWKPVKDTFEPVAPYLRPVSQFLGKIWNFLYSHINGRFIRAKPIYYKIQGPSKILIDNELMIPNNKMFTSKEINYIFSKQ
ncbi:hypothetical protein KGF54_001786 [Candida jiufengensis]|uniref:uncharacterized protein n=1 Tax=Candida jiufengensis TaxID=497108 RepID=UPI002224625C|nr:uncharacterized protein KGF54_001786 [Candida jiufengensis]KAI5955225.1 hypothetical protein KGF54_001786 [Candida jiufengensis]